MQEKYEDLAQEVRNSIADKLLAQQQKGFQLVADMDTRITNTNFVTNGGGAIACMTYLGTAGVSLHIQWSLVLFTLGVISTGIELRAKFSTWGALTSDASRRLRGFLNNELTVAQVAPVQPKNKISTRISGWSGRLSQVLFVLGVLVGGIGFLFPDIVGSHTTPVNLTR